MNVLAPIAFFVYKRPKHTLQALTALLQNDLAKDSHLYIFCDGPKALEDQAPVLEVRRVVASQKWCGQVEFIERSENMGLAYSIISCVSSLCSTYGKVIVLEDDLVTSPYFLSYMNSSLDRYALESRVVQVSGYMFPVKHAEKPDAFFLPFTTTWGWGTWNRVWKIVDWQATGALDRLQNFTVRHHFDLDGTYPYTKMLQDCIQGKNQSWGVLFYWWVFSQQKLALHPRQSLVLNTGLDGSGYHSSVPTVGFNVSPDGFTRWNQIVEWQVDLKVHHTAYKIIKNYLDNLSPSIIRRIASHIKISLKNITQGT